MSQWFGTRDGPWDESVVTRALDQVLGEGDGEGGRPRRMIPLQVIERNLDSGRADDQGHSRGAPGPPFLRASRVGASLSGTTIGEPRSGRGPRPDPDFHERCTFVADHPALQRRLGLVIDVRVADPRPLEKSTHLTATIGIDGDHSLCRSTRTRCQAVGDDLVTIGASEDWHQGALRLGDAATFAVLDMDPDGTALKLDRFLWALPRLTAMEEEGTPTQAAPTALRSVGFTVARRKKALDHPGPDGPSAGDLRCHRQATGPSARR